MATTRNVHRRWTTLAGHGRAHFGATYTVSASGSRSSGSRSFLAEFLVTSVSFTIAHGVFLFLAAVLGILGELPDAAALRQATVGIVMCHALALSFDAVRLDKWPFARLKRQATQVMSRVVLVHMAILGGMVFLAWRGTPGAFFWVFVGLKLFWDIGSLLPQWDPREPPRWLLSVMNRFPAQKGERFEDYWRRTRIEEDAQAEHDERDGPRRGRRSSTRA